MTPRLVVVSAGTYHLPFDRLSRWVEDWLGNQEDVRLVMQHGPSAPVAGAENVDMLPYDELLALCREATAVVLQGGAGGVMDMRALGITPVVVPRVPGGGEVVDDHQLVFTAEMEALGVIRRALCAADLARLLDQALAGDSTCAPCREVAAPGAAAVRELMQQPIRVASPWARVPRMLRSTTAIVAARLRH